MTLDTIRGGPVKLLPVAALSRALTGRPSRRDVLRGLFGAGLGLGSPRLAELADAKKRKGSKQKRKARPNEFGCLEVGDPCQNAGQCCSGICQGKKGKKRCRAHGTGTCQQNLPGLCSDPPTIALCNGSESCACLTSTAKSNFCAQLGSPVCIACRKDADCEAAGLPAGSACLPTTGLLCQSECPETGMVCLPPCGVMVEPEA